MKYSGSQYIHCMENFILVGEFGIFFLIFFFILEDNGVLEDSGVLEGSGDP